MVCGVIIFKDGLHIYRSSHADFHLVHTDFYREFRGIILTGDQEQGGYKKCSEKSINWQQVLPEF